MEKRDYYLFNDNETGEDFFVNTDTKDAAVRTANFYFSEPILIDVLTEEESEWYPYDVY